MRLFAMAGLLAAAFYFISGSGAQAAEPDEFAFVTLPEFWVDRSKRWREEQSGDVKSVLKQDWTRDGYDDLAVIKVGSDNFLADLEIYEGSEYGHLRLVARLQDAFRAYGYGSLTSRSDSSFSVESGVLQGAGQRYETVIAFRDGDYVIAGFDADTIYSEEDWTFQNCSWNLLTGRVEFVVEPEEPRCSIPDDHINPRRSALFMARSVLREVR
ncbi:hypothetical protein Q4543_00005, partial [Salipiger sp. 1_MG-2023]|uniref:hypothetical protein n=1 Tax=Salipiger sp. 1_MG-2023 TaxID=3062665 RepID=UPI0026E481E7